MVPRLVIDVSSSSDDDSSSDDSPRPPPSPAAQLPFQHTLVVLAPLYPELARLASPSTRHTSSSNSSNSNSPTSSHFPATFRRTAAGLIQLVFPHVASGGSARNAQAPLEKELVCAGLASDGCRNCRFAQLVRGLLVLIEQRILRVDAAYVVTAGVATLQLAVQLHEDAGRHTGSLHDFEFLLSHLQPAILSVASYTRVDAAAAALARQQQQLSDDALKKARESTCHVVGCNLHERDGHLPGVSSTTLFLSDVFRTLTSPTVLDQMAIRDDRTYAERMTRATRHVIVTDLPIVALQTLVCLMNARDLAALSSVCSLFQHLAYEVVPGLNLMLYRHQQKALKFLLYREAPASAHSAPLPHPFLFPPMPQREPVLTIDLVDGKLVKQVVPAVQDCRGGLFCDEPGLGKTITMLALLLRTKGQRSRAPTDADARDENPFQHELHGRLRSAGARGRTVQPRELIESIASLIVVPAPLVEHWQFQIETHVEPGALKVFVDNGKALLTSAELAQYDVVITSLERLAREWKFNRPTSALEDRAPERYGFEDQMRFVDGSARGEVSPLLRVHWVRVVVDEGHKLGGTSENSQMRMARVFSADKRWVMTGTPTPNTMQSADLRNMHGLLVFLKDAPYGHPDGKAWLKAVARPFEKNEPIAFVRVQHLLSRIMMRHTKASIRDILPDPIRRTVFIDPTPAEHEMYNAVTASVRSNLVVTKYDPKTPGRLHPDSLLNPNNRKYAMQVVRNLRIATCGGMKMTALLADKDLLDTINMMVKIKMEEDRRPAVIQYLHRARQNAECTMCEKCRRNVRLLLLIPCGHLCCVDCVEDCMEAVGARCSVCNVGFDFEVFQELQPGFEFTAAGGGPMEDLNSSNGAARVRDLRREAERRESLRAWQEQQRTGGTTRAPQPRLAINFLRDFDIIEASKALYVVARVKELKVEYARNYVEASTANRAANASRHVKAIVFSQFSSHIWELKVAFAQQGIPTADFITGVSAAHRKKHLRSFREDPSMNVLLLTEVGSHGLDLSFVTHMFLLEEIWDKSLEKQVVSRAHRMGARQPVVVEQLVMRDTIEGVLLRMNEQILKRQERRLKAIEAEEQSVLSRNEEQGASLPQPTRVGSLKGRFQPQKKSKKRHQKAKLGTHAAAMAPAAMDNDTNENKATRLQRQLYYVLQNIRLLGDDVAAEPGHVRFYVEDEQGTVLRRGSHRMAAYKTSTGELVTVPPEATTTESGSSLSAGSSNATVAATATRSTTTYASDRTHVDGVRKASAAVVKTEARTNVPALSAREPVDASADVATRAAATAAISNTRSADDSDASGERRQRKKARTSKKSKSKTKATSVSVPPSRVDTPPAPSSPASQPQPRVKAEVGERSGDPAPLSPPAPPATAMSVPVKSEREPQSEQPPQEPRVSVKAEAPLKTESSASSHDSPRSNSDRSNSASPAPQTPRSRSRAARTSGSVKRERSPPSQTAPPASRLGTLADPIVLTDEDEDEEMPLADASADAPAPPTAAAGAVALQKRPARRVMFAFVDDDDGTETESDFVRATVLTTYERKSESL